MIRFFLCLFPLFAISACRDVVNEKTKPMGRWQSTQFHIEVNPLSPEGVTLINIFNVIAVHMNQAVAQKFGKDDTGHLDIYRDYANAKRFYPNHWFTGSEDLQQFVHTIPSLIKQEGDTITPHVFDESGKVTHSKLGVALDEGAIWWPARPRVSFASETSPGTIELRPFPSLEPEYIVQLADDLRRVTEFMVEWIKREGTTLTKKQANELLKDIHTQLPKQSYLFPFALE